MVARASEPFPIRNKGEFRGDKKRLFEDIFFCGWRTYSNFAQPVQREGGGRLVAPGHDRITRGEPGGQDRGCANIR